MADEYDDPILHHEYDGIHEYDNPMPGWWKGIFWLTILWSIAYVVAIGLGYVWEYEEDLREGQAELATIRKNHERAQPPLIINDAMLALALADPAKVSAGKEVFASSCAVCHGDAGQGIIGPNLTDDHWLYGAQLTDLHRVIRDGAPNGMPPWGSVLAPQQVVDVVAYVRTLHGTNPANAKAPQGELVQPKEGEADPAGQIIEREDPTLSP